MMRAEDRFLKLSVTEKLENFYKYIKTNNLVLIEGSFDITGTSLS